MLRIEKLAFGLLLTLMLGFSFAMSAHAAVVRHVIVDQLDWNANLGLILEIYNDTATDTAVAQSKTAQVMFCLGTGTKWRSLFCVSKWEPGKDYTVKAVAMADKAELYLDGKKRGSDKGAFKMFDSEPLINGVPEWCTGQKTYGILVKSIKVTTSEGNDFEATYDAADYDPLLRPISSKDWRISTDDTSFTIEFVFQVIPEA